MKHELAKLCHSFVPFKAHLACLYSADGIFGWPANTKGYFRKLWSCYIDILDGFLTCLRIWSRCLFLSEYVFEIVLLNFKCTYTFLLFRIHRSLSYTYQTWSKDRQIHIFIVLSSRFWYVFELWYKSSVWVKK